MTVQDTGIAGGEQVAALAPVRAYLLRGARAEADRIVGQARSQADQALRQARRDAEQAVRQAREEGEAQAAPAAAAERARGREQARSIVLGRSARPARTCARRSWRRPAGCGTNRATSGWWPGSARWPRAPPDPARPSPRTGPEAWWRGPIAPSWTARCPGSQAWPSTRWATR